jgi:hypothetical protein
MKHGIIRMIPRPNSWSGDKIIPPDQRSHRYPSNLKTILIYFFNMRGIIHFEFLPGRATINQTN